MGSGWNRALDMQRAFRSLRRATKGLCPLETRELLKKLDQNFHIDIAGCETIKSPNVHTATMQILDNLHIV